MPAARALITCATRGLRVPARQFGDDPLGCWRHATADLRCGACRHRRWGLGLRAAGGEQERQRRALRGRQERGFDRQARAGSHGIPSRRRRLPARHRGAMWASTYSDVNVCRSRVDHPMPRPHQEDAERTVTILDAPSACSSAGACHAPRWSRSRCGRRHARHALLLALPEQGRPVSMRCCVTLPLEADPCAAARRTLDRSHLIRSSYLAALPRPWPIRRRVGCSRWHCSKVEHGPTLRGGRARAYLNGLRNRVASGRAGFRRAARLDL